MPDPLPVSITRSLVSTQATGRPAMSALPADLRISKSPFAAGLPEQGLHWAARRDLLRSRTVWSAPQLVDFHFDVDVPRARLIFSRTDRAEEIGARNIGH